jgi:predicted PurR-regulated permease PerM
VEGQRSTREARVVRVAPPARPGRTALFWLAVFAVVFGLLWLLRPILLPFVLGMALGYVLDPLVARLERRGLSRAVTAAVLIVGAVVVTIVLVVLLTPLVITQVTDLAGRLPVAVGAAYERLEPHMSELVARMRSTPAGDLTAPVVNAAKEMATNMTGVVAGLLTRGLEVVNLLTLLAVTPLVAFYLLRDWPKIVAEIDDWIPRAHVDTIHAELREIDHVLAGFARGQAIVCLVLMAFYGIALSVARLDYGLTIGLVAGVVSFVPYLGFAVGLTSSVGVALYQYWPAWGPVIVVLAIFLVGQLVSDYVLTPRLVGGQVGLHPLWVIFAVFAGGLLFGFAGMLFAVPVCAVIGVLARFGISRYKTSEFYQGPAA